MARQMPKEMQELLYQIDDPDIINGIHQKWNELVAANDNYELNYPQQFGNLVDGNMKFKEQKSIPTPAEQMQMYESMVLAEIHDRIDDKEKGDNEATYELEPDEQAPPDKVQTADQFRLTFSDMSEPKADKDAPEKEKAPDDKELNVTWLQAYQEERAQEQQQPELPDQQQPYTLQLNFGKLEELDRSDMEIEPDEPEMEKD
ncbi:MAG: hypothetical protein JST70_01895 [Bacteroidetes bacterium]|nr:hypothetical protein [Bacteroidota bacterium]